VARTAEQLESFRRVWAGLVEDELQTDPDYFLWSLAGEAQVLRPHVLAVDRDGRTDAILVARLSEIRMPSKLGYATVYAPTVRALSVVHDGLLGQQDCGIAEAVLDELFAGIELGVADVVLFRQLQRESPLRQAVQERASFLTRQRIARTEHRWQIDLPNTFEDYLASLSSTTRKGIRRTSAQVEKAFGDRLSIRRFQDVADLEVYLRDAESVAARTYQRSLGVGFLDDERQRARARMLMEHGWFRSYVLYLDGRPVAFEQGEAYGSRFVSVRAGYDPAHGQHRIGAYLLVKAIEDLVRDARFSIFDFGLGDAEYKRKLAHRSIEEGDLAVFARRARPIRINIARTGLQGVSSGVTASLRKVALLDASKQWWRRHATRRSRRR
jgi:CelD/BcsL family acetyltransferase involved in cellulose biosynthesis